MPREGLKQEQVPLQKATQATMYDKYTTALCGFSTLLASLVFAALTNKTIPLVLCFNQVLSVLN